MTTTHRALARQFRASLAAQLVEETAMFASWDPVGYASDAYDCLEAEQDRRSISDPDAAHAYALADSDGMTCEHGYNPAVCDGYGNVGRAERLARARHHAALSTESATAYHWI